jgi:hypothetical protein
MAARVKRLTLSWFPRLEIGSILRGRWVHPARVCPYTALEAHVEADINIVATEHGVLRSWAGNTGVVRRPCGCDIFAKSGSETLYLHEGDEVEFEVAYSEFKRTFIAQRLEKPK